MSDGQARDAVADAINGDRAQFDSAVEKATLRALSALATQHDLGRSEMAARISSLETAVDRLRNAITAAVTSIGVAVVIAAILAALSR